MLVPIVVAAVGAPSLLGMRLGGQVCALTWPAHASCFAAGFDWVLSVGAGGVIAVAAIVVALGLLVPSIRRMVLVAGVAAMLTATATLAGARLVLFGPLGG